MFVEVDKLQSILDMPFLEVVLENSSACIILAEAPSGKIIYINNAVKTFRGPTDAPLDGILLEEYVLSWRDLYPDGTPMKSEEMPLARAILHGEVISNEEVIVELDNGDWRWALASASPIRDKQGQIVAGIVSWFDITQYKQNQQMLEQAQDEIKTLQGIIPICSYCHKIRDDEGAWEQLEAYITKHSHATFSHGICPKCLVSVKREIAQMKQQEQDE